MSLKNKVGNYLILFGLIALIVFVGSVLAPPESFDTGAFLIGALCVALFFSLLRRPSSSTPFPYTTLFRSWRASGCTPAPPAAAASLQSRWKREGRRGMWVTRRAAGMETRARQPAQLARQATIKQCGCMQRTRHCTCQS